MSNCNANDDLCTAGAAASFNRELKCYQVSNTDLSKGLTEGWKTLLETKAMPISNCPKNAPVYLNDGSKASSPPPLTCKCSASCPPGVTGSRCQTTCDKSATVSGQECVCKTGWCGDHGTGKIAGYQQINANASITNTCLCTCTDDYTGSQCDTAPVAATTLVYGLSQWGGQ